MSKQGITGIDHPVVCVHDLESARIAYERLGFTIPGRGIHSDWGTGNLCMMFKNDYLELRGALDPGKATPQVREVLDRPEGLMGLALVTLDAEVTRMSLAASGVRSLPVRELTRHFELPGETRDPRFALCFLEDEEAPGLMSVVCCQHLTPDLIREPEWLEHPNGVRSVTGVTSVVEDIERSGNRLARIFGSETVKWDGCQISLSLPRNQQIVAMPVSHLSTVYPSEFVDQLLGSRDKYEGLAVLSLCVRDVESTTNLLIDRNVRFQSHRGKIYVSPLESLGVLIELGQL